MVPQPCTGQPPIWAFDFTAGLCVQYKTGFCQANANKFYSKAECEEYCGVVQDGEIQKKQYVHKKKMQMLTKLKSFSAFSQMTSWGQTEWCDKSSLQLKNNVSVHEVQKV